MKKESKQLKNVNNLEKEVTKLKRKKIQNPRTVQNAIKYEQMLENGICQVDDTLYSKTIKFDDINYQIAPADAQVSIFRKYCGILNLCDETTHMQISIVNRKLDEQEFETNIKIPDMNCAKYPKIYRDEFNNVLKSYSLDSKESMIREKYITFTTEEEEYEEAAKSLNRFEDTLRDHLESDLHCINHTLNGMERLKLLHSFFNPKDIFDFSYSSLVRSNLKTKDYIAPTSLDFTNFRYFSTGDYYGSTLFIKNLPADLGDTFFQKLTELNINMTVTLHIDGIAKEKAMRLVDEKIMYMDQEKVNEQLKANQRGYDRDMLPHELVHRMDEALELKDDLQNKDQNLFKVTILMYTYGSDLEELQDNIYKIAKIGSAYSCKIDYLDYLQEAGMNATLLLGKNHVPIKRTLTTAATAVFIPFASQELMSQKGNFYGINGLSKNLIMFDRRILSTPSGFFFGKPGAGKSMLSKEEYTQVLYRSNDDVLILDPENENIPMAKELKGTIINLYNGSSYHINPFDITEYYGDNEDPLKAKSDYLLTLIDLMIGGKDGLSVKKKSILDKCIIKCYEKVFEERNFERSNMPTFKTLFSELKSLEDETAQDMAIELEIYVNGSLDLFSQLTNVDVDERFIDFAIRDLGTQLKPLAMTIILDHFWGRVISNFKKNIRTWIYTEEMHLFFKDQRLADTFDTFYKRFRKFGGVPSGITQNVDQVLINDTARLMIANSDFLVLLNQSKTDSKVLSEILSLSDEQLNYISNATPGKGLICAGGTIVPFKNHFPKETELYRLMSTKFGEEYVKI